jgi:DNA-3-methyladenine glycosylase
MPKSQITCAGWDSRRERSLRELPPLPASFYAPDPRQVGRELLGKVLVRRETGRLLAGRIVETEAYLGTNDPAAHAAAGRTARNFVLFGPPGRAYVYLVYGNYWCLNVSTLPDGEAGGVLFRALEPIAGLEAMARARGLDSSHVTGRPARLLTSGPGRMAQALGVTRARDNNKNLCDFKSDLVIVDDGSPAPKVGVTVRVGITKAVNEPLRYIVAGNPFVSGPALRL